MKMSRVGKFLHCKSRVGSGSLWENQFRGRKAVAGSYGTTSPLASWWRVCRTPLHIVSRAGGKARLVPCSDLLVAVYGLDNHWATATHHASEGGNMRVSPRLPLLTPHFHLESSAAKQYTFAGYKVFFSRKGISMEARTFFASRGPPRLREQNIYRYTGCSQSADYQVHLDTRLAAQNLKSVSTPGHALGLNA